MEPRTLLAFIALETLLCLAPGPAVLTVFGCALEAGWRGGLASTFGILVSNGVYFVISAAGLSTLLHTYPTFFSVLQWAGAAYLVVLGARMVLASPAAGPAGSPRGAGARSFGRAVMVQITNPKALVFFGALLPQFVDPARDVPLQLLILGITGGLVEFAVLAFYTALATHGLRRFPGGGFATVSRRVAGAWLVVLGAVMGIARLR